MKYIVLFAILGVAFAASAQPEEDFMEALGDNNYVEANRIFDQNNLNPNYPSSNERIRGATPLLVALRAMQWVLVERMLDNGADVNATPPAGAHHSGVTPLWIAAALGRWPLFDRMLDMGANADAAPTQGNLQGTTALSIAATRQQWALVARVLLKGSGGFLNTHPGVAGNAVTEMIDRSGPKWLKTVYPLLVPGEDNSLYDAMESAVDAFLVFQDDSRVLLSLPEEIRWKLAEAAILVQFPELQEVPAEFQERVTTLVQNLFRCIRMYAIEDQKQSPANRLPGYSREVIAARALANFYPISKRHHRNEETVKKRKEKVRKIRRWIMEEGAKQLGEDRILTKNERDELVSMLSNTKLSVISRKWIREQFLAFANGDYLEQQPVAMAEEPGVEHKRGRDDGNKAEQAHDLSKLKIRIRRPKIDAPRAEGDLRTELILTVIRDQPGLDRDQVNARVDEMMLDGAQPMDIDEENPMQGNLTESAPNGLDAAILQNAFHRAVMMRHLHSIGS